MHSLYFTPTEISKLTQVANYAPAGLTNPAGVRICQSEPGSGILFFQLVATWVKLTFFENIHDKHRISQWG